jgi:hypothetical protein
MGHASEQQESHFGIEQILRERELDSPYRGVHVESRQGEGLETYIIVNKFERTAWTADLQECVCRLTPIRGITVK